MPEMLSELQMKLLKKQAVEYCDFRDGPTQEYLEGRGISNLIADIKWLGTVTGNYPGHEQYQGWLSIPYVTALGYTVGFKFRRLDSGQPRYGSPAGQKSHLYNVTDFEKIDSIIAVCEGELDTVILSEVVGIPAVGCPGVASWKKHYAKLFSGYEKIIIVGDNDAKEDGSNPGQDFARRVAQEVQNTQIVLLPSGMDITDCYLAEGAEGVRERLGFQWNKSA